MNIHPQLIGLTIQAITPISNHEIRVTVQRYEGVLDDAGNPSLVGVDSIFTIKATADQYQLPILDISDPQ